MAPNMTSQAFIPFAIGITGHRNISRVEEDRVRPALDAFFSNHARAYPFVPLRLLSGLAEGADRIVARVFLEVRSRLMAEGRDGVANWELVATIPFSEQSYKDDFPETQDEFYELMAAASDVVAVTQTPAEALRREPSLRDNGYEAQGYYMLRHSNMIIALWDGIHLELRGGTSHVVRLKLNGHESPDNPFSVHDCGSVFHIPVQRSEPSNSHAPMAPRHLFPAAHPNGEKDLEELKIAIGRFNQSAHLTVQPDDIAQSLRYLSPSDEDGTAAHQHWLDRASGLDLTVINAFAATDTMASCLDKKRIRFTRVLYGAGMILALALWIGLDRIAQGWMVGLYLCALGLIVALYKRLKQRDLAIDRLDYRLLAEALRVQIYWRMLDGMKSEHEAPDDQPEAEFLHAMVLDGLLSQQALEMGWLREVLRLCGMDRNPTRLSRADRALHLHHWISDQSGYFARTERRYDRQHSILRGMTLAAAVCGILAAACVVWIDQQDLPDSLRHYASIAAASLPAAALLLESYKDRMAIEEQAKNMARMKGVFHRSRDRLKGMSTSHMPPLGLIRALGQEALAESANWLILRRSKPTVLPT